MTHDFGDTVVDLHAHSTESDGSLRPAELVARAAGAGVGVLALTDHDTMTGVAEAREAAAEHGIQLVPGVEISCRARSESLHLLGLFVDPEDPELTRMFTEISAERRKRVRESCEQLAAVGVEVRFEEVEARCTGASVGRPHIAEVLVEKGLVADRDEAFDRYLGDGKPGHVSYGKKLSVAEAARAVHAAGGVTSLAHPKYLKPQNVVPILREGGLKAIEAFHGDHSEPERRRYLDIARAEGLMVTGGSDFHTPTKNGKLGSALPWERFAELRRAAG